MKYNKIIVYTNPAGIEIISAALIDNAITEFQIDNPRDTLDMIEGLKPTEWYDPDQIPEVSDGPAKIVIWEPVEEKEAGGEPKSRDEQKAGDEPGRATLEFLVRDIVARIKADLASGLFGENADLGTLEISVEAHEDSEWKDKWKEYFRPTRVSERIIVKPTWWEEPDDSDSGELGINPEIADEAKNAGMSIKSLSERDILIEIDPGQAFGTGTHETTSLTLKHMEDYIKPGDKVLDVGVGSGILSIAAVKLGASEVLGIDIDEEAVRVSKENFILNGVDAFATAIQGDLLKGLGDGARDAMAEMSEGRGFDGSGKKLPYEKADVVVANLLSDLVIMLTPAVKDYIKEGGVYISSGILTEKEEQVAETIRASGFRIIETKYDGEWCSIAAAYQQ